MGECCCCLPAANSRHISAGVPLVQESGDPGLDSAGPAVFPRTNQGVRLGLLPRNWLSPRLVPHRPRREGRPERADLVGHADPLAVAAWWRGWYLVEPIPQRLEDLTVPSLFARGELEIEGQAVPLLPGVPGLSSCPAPATSVLSSARTSSCRNCARCWRRRPWPRAELARFRSPQVAALVTSGRASACSPGIGARSPSCSPIYVGSRRSAKPPRRRTSWRSSERITERSGSTLPSTGGARARYLIGRAPLGPATALDCGPNLLAGQRGSLLGAPMIGA